ncbi:hypothetical protein Anapl_06621 [Anas platyrhynchos]|uniref:Uncharacterized protein n=1 Tax=Anas platyrhynchos TaxID=8839 RepID=R0M467_ANAPL|nr:hypothetical protein Anapl_06621 [Anas platyrhynchos]
MALTGTPGTCSTVSEEGFQGPDKYQCIYTLVKYQCNHTLIFSSLKVSIHRRGGEQYLPYFEAVDAFEKYIHFPYKKVKVTGQRTRLQMSFLAFTVCRFAPRLITHTKISFHKQMLHHTQAYAEVVYNVKCCVQKTRSKQLVMSEVKKGNENVKCGKKLLNGTKCLVTQPSSPVAPLVDHYLKHLRPELYIYVTRMSSGLHRNLLGFACNTVRTGDDAAAEPTATCAKREVSPLCHKSLKPRNPRGHLQELCKCQTPRGMRTALGLWVGARLEPSCEHTHTLLLPRRGQCPPSVRPSKRWSIRLGLAVTTRACSMELEEGSRGEKSLSSSEASSLLWDGTPVTQDSVSSLHHPQIGSEEQLRKRHLNNEVSHSSFGNNHFGKRMLDLENGPAFKEKLAKPENTKRICNLFWPAKLADFGVEQTLLAEEKKESLEELQALVKGYLSQQNKFPNAVSNSLSTRNEGLNPGHSLNFMDLDSINSTAKTLWVYSTSMSRTTHTASDIHIMSEDSFGNYLFYREEKEKKHAVDYLTDVGHIITGKVKSENQNLENQSPTTQQRSHNTPAKLTAKQISKEKGQLWRLVSQKSPMTKHFFSEDVQLGNQCHEAAGIVK